jgi:hypothetical protein
VKSLWLKDFNFITSGYTKNGTDLGENFTILKAPKIALLSGKESVPLNLEPFGFIWMKLLVILLVSLKLVLIVWNSLSTTLLSSRWFYDFSVDQQNKLPNGLKMEAK